MKKEFQKKRQRAREILESKFPNWNPLDSSFNATLNEKGEVVAILTDRKNAVPHVIVDEVGNVKEKEISRLQKIQDSLGPRAEDIVERNREEMTRREKKKRRITSFT